MEQKKKKKRRRRRRRRKRKKKKKGKKKSRFQPEFNSGPSTRRTVFVTTTPGGTIL